MRLAHAEEAKMKTILADVTIRYPGYEPFAQFRLSGTYTTRRGLVRAWNNIQKRARVIWWIEYDGRGDLEVDRTDAT